MGIRVKKAKNRFFVLESLIVHFISVSTIIDYTKHATTNSSLADLHSKPQAIALSVLKCL